MSNLQPLDLDQNVSVETLYTTEKMATILGIKEPTVRKYLATLSKKGYEFRLKKDGTRKLGEEELILLRKIVELKNKPNVTIEDAVQTVVLAQKKGHDISDITKKAEVSPEQMMDFLEKLYQELKNSRQDIAKLTQTVDYLNQELSSTKKELLETKQMNEKVLLIETAKNNNEQEKNDMMETWKSQQINLFKEVNTQIENTIAESFRKVQEQSLANPLKNKKWYEFWK